MPDLHGVEVCRQLRADPRFSPTVPIIITTAGPSGRAQRLEAYQAGAWEFLGQPLDGESLLLKLDAFLRAKLEVDRVHDESLLDQVTGLYNMRGLSRRAREIGSEAFRRRHALTCIVFAPESPAARRRDHRGGGHPAGRGGGGGAPQGRPQLRRHRSAGAARICRHRPRHRARRGAEARRSAPGNRRNPPRPDERWRRPPRWDFVPATLPFPTSTTPTLDATEMLLRATTALRALKVDGAGTLRAFEN